MLRTFSGLLIDPLSIDSDDVALVDIARGLALNNRWNCQLRDAYSVAEHSIRVAGAVPAEMRLEALLHDACEAYLRDLPKPLKERPEMEAYREAEARCDEVIRLKFGLPRIESAEVLRADRWLRGVEARDLISVEHPAWREVEGDAKHPLFPEPIAGVMAWRSAEIEWLGAVRGLLAAREDRAMTAGAAA